MSEIVPEWITSSRYAPAALIAREICSGRRARRRRGKIASRGCSALHLICDNYATHKHPKVQAWVSKHKRVHVHFTPTSASWLNMVERFFRDLSTERLDRGVLRSVPELITAIQEYVSVHNKNPKPFIWTAKAADILQKVIRANRRLSSKQNEALH